MDSINNRINKFRALYAIYSFFRELIVFLQIFQFIPIVFAFNGVNLWLCVMSLLVYIALSRILWVKFEFKSATYRIVYNEVKKEKIEYLATNFR